MSDSVSAISIHDASGSSYSNLLNGNLTIPSYRFQDSVTMSLTHGENVSLIHGYRVSSKRPVIAKLSTNTTQLEREFHIMRKLYQLAHGPSYIVCPIEYLNLTTGVAVAIYADDGYNYLKHRSADDPPHGYTAKTPTASSNRLNSRSETSSTDANIREWLQSRYSTANDLSPSTNELPPETLVMRKSAPTYDLITFLRFAIKACDAIEFIHRQNCTHGQIKLSSLQWERTDDNNGFVKVWNFGSGTRALDLSAEKWRKIAANKELTQMMQTALVYMSPEQTGRTTYTPDHRSDIYSLGISFFVLLTGQSPFEGGPLEILNGILSRKVPLIHEVQQGVPEVISQIVEKMTNKTPGDRYSSAHGLRSDLKECLKRILESTRDGNHINFKAIEEFTLAQHDIASVFTLPKTVYGRRSVISQMNTLIDDFVNTYVPNRILRSHDRPAQTANSISTGGYHVSTISSIADTLSDSSRRDDCNNSVRSNSSPSFVSGVDESETSSAIQRGSYTDKNGTRQKTSTVVVSLYGPGGIGKSTMFSAVQATARQHGYIAASKFDSRNKVPYSCVLKSLSQILQQILSESEEDIKLFHEHLKVHLGAQFCNVSLLNDFVPELRSLLDPTSSTLQKNDVDSADDEIHMDNVETQARFQNLFIGVFRAISNWCMTTLFLDDLHQADDHSLELLESLMRSRINILIFISYRDQEVTPMLGEVLENGASFIQFISVEPLDMESTIDFLCDTLHRPRDVRREYLVPLAEFVLKKTNGNAFYTAQLLQALDRKKLIFFDWQKNEWDYNLAEIKEATTYSNESDTQLDVSFMVARLRELPVESQSLLKWASFIGDTFSWTTVKELMLSSDVMDEQSDISSDIESECSLVDDTASEDTARETTSSSRDHKTKRHHRPSLVRTSTAIPLCGSQKSSFVNDPMIGLQAVLQEGYIMPIGPEDFKWAHDRIAQAAGELAGARTRSKIHLAVAQHIMKEQIVDSFLAADHLIKCFELLTTIQDKEPYRRLLIEAGNKGRSSGAHGMAFTYYSAAIELGDPAHEWEGSNYTTTLHLYTNAVALSWVVGQNEQTEELLKVVFKNARTSIDRLTAFRMQAKYYFGIQQHDKGRGALHQCLKDLGEEYHDNLTEESLKREFDEAEQMVGAIGREQVVNMKPCDDPSLRGIMSVLEELCTVAYWGGNKPEMYYCAIRIIRMSLENGVSPVFTIGCNFAGIGYSTLYKKFSFAEEIGSIGLQLADKHSGIYEKGRAYLQYSVFVTQWKYHQRECLKYFTAGMNLSLSAGDRIYVAFHQTHRLVILFCLNNNIADTLREAESNYDDIHTWSSSVDTNMFAMCIIRVCKALQGHTYIHTPDVFDGDDGFNNEHYVKESCKQSSNPELILNWYDTFYIIAQTLYGHTDSAIATGYKTVNVVDDHPCHRHARIYLHYFSLALMDRLHQQEDDKQLEPAERKKYLKQVHENQVKVHEYARHSRINYIMFWTLIEAELSSLQNESLKGFGKTCRLYEDAINQAREGGWHLEICVAYERAGAFYLRNDIHNVAFTLLSKAINLYMAHGSYGKARQLSSKYAELLGDYSDDKREQHDTGVQTDAFPYLNTEARWNSDNEASEIPINNHSLSDPLVGTGALPPMSIEDSLVKLDILDMASILKSSQVMSSEIGFEELLRSMMNIIFENSGANCVAVIIKDENHGVCAYGKEGAMTTYDPPLSLSEKDKLISNRIVHHTINTGESIFIRDVAQDSRFSVGPWFNRTGSKSVICIPIVHKSAMAGCLFIEGPVGIFTQRHITVLSLLCQQMGISITNAFLFKSVQRATKANMRMIELQKEALEEARKSKEAADKATRLREIFLANMSHEIRTPFSGFYGMISLLADTKLDSEQQDLVKTAKESCKMLLRIIDDLLNFSKLQAGKVSLDLSPVVIDELLADVIEMLIAMAIQKRINVTYTVASDVPSVVRADANRLRQVIINLLGNAIKFTHEGEINIRCSLAKSNRRRRVSDEQVSLLFEIIDTGIGISEEQRKVLFVPFSQVDGSTTRKYGGTGLGLSICLQLVQLMSGEINVESTPGKGSNFNFTARVSRIRDKSLKRNDAIARLLDSLRNARVLVAGAHVSTISMIKQLLPGVAVDGACSVDELVSRDKCKYNILIVGMFLTSDLHFKEWWYHLQKAVDQVRYVVVMHYPSGVVGELLGEIMEGGSSIGIPVRRMDQHAMVRIAVPVRRHRLLRTMVEILQQSADLPQPTNAVLSARHKVANGTSTIITPEEQSLFSTMHILAAEDNPVAQKLLYKQLTRLGFQVDLANNGLEAIEAWQNHPPGYFCVSLLDYHMPQCDGVEATRRIRKIEADEQRTTRLPIITLTADIQDSTRQTCLAVGMDGFLTKPVNMKLLTDTIRRFCHNSKKFENRHVL
ncbi:hypothetical protein BDB00DRAFT_938504 [Zychaea mexicana]|uniref:uncharacterized protein n=1 Tax=Zychaea mexicana TaxID=64656 RepID=UPI0022FDC390|nr:uncharacterized protein BDB00DRAFT_938504 [Zychaea mexicana]KAI9494152.1 hypothetical protein BDB00DRAFT_938504 [Zychaea mexicana]